MAETPNQTLTAYPYRVCWEPKHDGVADDSGGKAAKLCFD